MKKGLLWHLQTAQKSHGGSANEVYIVDYSWAGPSTPRYRITEPKEMGLLTIPSQALGKEQKKQGAHRAGGEKGSQAEWWGEKEGCVKLPRGDAKPPLPMELHTILAIAAPWATSAPG